MSDQTRHKEGRRAKPRNGFYIVNCGGFERKLLYVGGDRFDVAYMRHTEQLWEFMRGITLEECLEAMRTHSHLRPF